MQHGTNTYGFYQDLDSFMQGKEYISNSFPGNK